MANGKIKADTLEHSTAGSVDTQYVVSGSAKAWVNFNGTGTAAVNDSLSISSLVDNGTSVFTLTVAAAFANNQYSQVACLGHSNSNSGWGILEDTNVARTTTAVKIVSWNGDFAVNSMNWHGDLA
jgi:hypothetical protein